MKVGDHVKLVWKGGLVKTRSTITDIWENKFGGQDCYLDGLPGSYRITPDSENRVLFVIPDEEQQ